MLSLPGCTAHPPLAPSPLHIIPKRQWWTTDAEVEALTAPYGRILALRFIDDKSCGKSRGMAIVEYAEPGAADACIAGLNGCEAGAFGCGAGGGGWGQPCIAPGGLCRGRGLCAARTDWLCYLLPMYAQACLCSPFLSPRRDINGRPCRVTQQQSRGARTGGGGGDRGGQFAARGERRDGRGADRGRGGRRDDMPPAGGDLMAQAGGMAGMPQGMMMMPGGMMAGGMLPGMMAGESWPAQSCLGLVGTAQRIVGCSGSTPCNLAGAVCSTHVLLRGGCKWHARFAPLRSAPATLKSLACMPPLGCCRHGGCRGWI